MKGKAIALSLLIVGLASATGIIVAQNSVENQRTLIGAVGVADPAQQILEVARMVRANDLSGVVQATVPPSTYQQIRQAYELHRMQPTTEAERAEFAEGLAKLNAADAVDQLMAEIEPKLEEARPQVPAALLMGMGALQMAVVSKDSDLTEEERASLKQALPALQQWATTTDFLSSASMRQALTLVSDAVRGTGVQSLDQLKQMSFEQALGKAENVLAAGKQALRVYGLDVDAITDTLQVEVVAIDGATARVRSTITVFDAPVSREHDLVLVDGRWYAKGAVEHWSARATAQVDG